MNSETSREQSCSQDLETWIAELKDRLASTRPISENVLVSILTNCALHFYDVGRDHGWHEREQEIRDLLAESQTEVQLAAFQKLRAIIEALRKSEDPSGARTDTYWTEYCRALDKILSVLQGLEKEL